MEKHDIRYAWPDPDLVRNVSVLQMGCFGIQPPYACNRSGGWIVYNIIYTTAGAVEAVIDGAEYTAGPGTVLLLPKSTSHRLTVKNGSWEGYWIEYDGRWVDAIHRNCGFTGAAFIPGCNPLLPVFRELYALLDDDLSSPAVESVSYLWKVLAGAGLVLRDGRTGPDRTQQTLEAARRFARDNLQQGITVKDMAAAAGMSVFHFSRLFKEATGHPPGAYLRQVRINRACVLLRNTQLNVSEVGQAVGYPVVQHFSTVFKRTVGVTPRGYRG